MPINLLNMLIVPGRLLRQFLNGRKMRRQNACNTAMTVKIVVEITDVSGVN
jgi:hypothetical protein